MKLNYLNSNKKNFLASLETIINKRRAQNPKNYLLVKKIIQDVKKNKDKALIKYEKKYSKKNKIKTTK